MYKGPTRKFKARGIRKKRQKKQTEYGEQLLEKQKLRKVYGIREKTLKNYFTKASKKKIEIDLALIQFLERRLDNVLYRLGWGQTRPQTGQLINHAHILVNEKTVKIPSYQVGKGDIIEIKSTKKELYPYKNLSAKIEKHTPPVWLLYKTKDKMKAEVMGEPAREDFGEPINLSSILQFYSR